MTYDILDRTMHFIKIWRQLEIKCSKGTIIIKI